MEVIYKEVDFHKYCPSCKHKSKKDSEDPCNECLSEPMNVNTSKPMKWEALK